MRGGQGQGGGRGGPSAGMAMALGVLAIAAGAGAVIVQEHISERNRRKRLQQAERRRAELESGRAATLSNESCHDHRYRGPVQLPRLLDSIQTDQIPLGLPILAMANVMEFLDLSSCFSLRRVSTSWNQFLRQLFRYKPYIKRMVWRGDFHNERRCRYWIAILDANDRLAQSAHLYCQLVNVGEDPFDSDATGARIRRDISRTMPEVESFRSGSKSESLYRLLCCYALADRQVGYCQGMNYVAAYLLTLEIETKAFAFFDILMQDYQYRWIFAPGLPHLRLCLFQLDRLLAMFLPSLHLHLTEEAVSGELYASEWFVSLFTYSFTIDDVGRIWDLFFVFGWKSLIKVALAILARAEPQLVHMRFEMIIQAVKHRPSTLLCGNVEEIISRASQFKVTNSLLRALEDQYWLENNA